MSKNETLLSRLKDVECRDATYWSKDPTLVFERAQGSFIYDAEGRPYLDLCAGFGALPFGHNPSFLLDLFKEQRENKIPLIGHGMGDVYPSVSKINLLTKLQTMLPPHLTKGALALSGGQAVEIALKTSMLHSEKKGVLCFSGSYHGLDLGVLPTTARNDFRKPFQSWLREDLVKHIPFGCDQATFQAGVSSFDKEGVACVLVEPIQGRAGVVFPPDGWLQKLRNWCDEQNILLIFDEIWVGFGRTGRRFFADEVACDMICLGKSLGGGFPVSACFGRQEVMDAWPESSGEALHTGTFFGHPFSCEAAYRNLCEMEKSNLFERSKKIGESFLKDLRRNLLPSSRVKEIRGAGLMIAIEFTEPGYAAKLMDRMRARGVIVLPSGPTGQVLTLTPPLNIEEVHLIEFSLQLKDVMNGF